jgi:hypothetical protein
MTQIEVSHARPGVLDSNARPVFAYQIERVQHMFTTT